MIVQEYLPFPFLLSENSDGVRSVLKDIIVFGLFALNNIFGLLTNLNHGVAESKNTSLAKHPEMVRHEYNEPVNFL